MYKDTTIPSNFNKIADISDNYIVWVKDATLVNGTDYEAYYQFYSPSTWVMHTDNYRITKGDSYTLDANYINNGMYSYIDSYDASFSKKAMSSDSDNIIDSDYERGDFLRYFWRTVYCSDNFCLDL